MKALWDKIYITFIFDVRYLFFVEGIKITLILTFASFFLGTFFGILLCMMKRAKNKAVRKIAEFIAALFMGMPTMVLLMIMVYIVFGSSAVPVLWVVTIGLTLKAGAYLAEIFDTSLSTVDPGEVEAARTLGMTRWQAFRYIALPQTVNAALPLYKNQFITTMQETSVVGYLAVVDLTRAASIVSSRTLDAFFGLITVTIIYFMISAIAKCIFNLISKKVVRGGEPA